MGHGTLNDQKRRPKALGGPEEEGAAQQPMSVGGCLTHGGRHGGIGARLAWWKTVYIVRVAVLYILGMCRGGDGE